MGVVADWAKDVGKENITLSATLERNILLDNKDFDGIN
jgi:hypothetical protein